MRLPRRTRRKRLQRRSCQKRFFFTLERFGFSFGELSKAVALETDKRIKSFINKPKQRHRRRGRR